MNTTKKSHVAKSNWRYVGVKINSGEVRQMRMGIHLAKKMVKAYGNLVKEFNNVFAWLYQILKGILLEKVEHKISLVLGAKLI